MFSVELKAPVTVKLPAMETFPGMVIAPAVSIVSLATPPVTRAILSAPGLIIPVLKSPANFRAQLDKEPGASAELDHFPKVTDSHQPAQHRVQHMYA